MIIATAVISMAVFVGGLWVLGVARIGTDVLHVARDALATVRDKNVDDETREKAARRASLQFLRAFASILFRSAATLAASFIPIWLADAAGLARLEDVIAFLFRWDVVLIAGMLFTVAYFALQRASFFK